jgi:YVTN family beta-propeller protein
MRYTHLRFGTGDIISINIDASPPTAKLLKKPTGKGAGYTKGHPNGRYVYTLQSAPREGDTTQAPGATCQIGQIVVIDAQGDSVLKEVPLKYGAADCNTSIVGTAAATVGPGHILIAGSKMYVQTASGFADPTGEATKHLVVDLTDPANPVQSGALDIGRSRSHHDDILTGDGKWTLVTNNLENTVTVIDAALGTVAKTMTVTQGPATIATWHEHEGPSHQVGPLE